jgi:hypothetical protein
MVERPEGKGPLQRPRHSLQDTTKTELKEAVYEGVD